MKMAVIAKGCLLSAVAALAILYPAIARAQMFRLHPPINTTLVISLPAADQVYGDQQIVTLGVGTRLYKFVLNDAYVDSTRIRWPDIWEQVRTSRPNFVVQGPHSDDIEHLAPGQMVTVRGMFAPLTRTLEIVFTQPGRGPFEPREHY